MSPTIRLRYGGSKCFSLNCSTSGQSFYSYILRCFNSLPAFEIDPRGVDHSKITKSVLISQSNNVFKNLALEDWMYRNFNFKNHHVLMLWQNDPCVVIGRHQNPWKEANLGCLAEENILLARRNSGGGAVFHDTGNLNFTFFTPKEHYNRKANLSIICTAIKRTYNIDIKINEREDIVVGDNLKISGTASKLGRPNAYHHCTLLVSTNEALMSASLHCYEKGITSNATESKPSPVLNLRSLDNRITVKDVMEVIGQEYLQTRPVCGEDGKKDFLSHVERFHLVNPEEDLFPGIDEIQAEFESWAWIFGRTPKFSVSRTFGLPPNTFDLSEENSLSFSLIVNQGVVEDIKLKIPPCLASCDTLLKTSDIFKPLRGIRFTTDCLNELQFFLSDEGHSFVSDCIGHSMRSI